MCLPETVASNEDYTKIVDTSDEWIRTRTGMRERHISDGAPEYLMSVQSAKEAIADAGLTAEDIDLIIHTSVTPDYITPSMSSIGGRSFRDSNSNCFKNSSVVP